MAFCYGSPGKLLHETEWIKNNNTGTKTDREEKDLLTCVIESPKRRHRPIQNID